MGVVATRAIRPFVISDTITVFLNNVVVSFKSDGGRAPENLVLVSDTLVPDHRVLTTIDLIEPVDTPTLIPAVSDTLVPDYRVLLQIPLTEPVDPDPVPPTLTDTAVVVVTQVAFDMPPETVTWDVPSVGATESVTMIVQNLYQINLTETVSSTRPDPNITDTVNTLLT
jgi:hypothetical protein